MTVSVFLNTAILTLDGTFSDEHIIEVLASANNIFTYIFLGELIGKLIALGPLVYLKDKMNLFDAIVMMLSVSELIFLSGNKAVSAFRAIRIFRTFRVLRVTRLLRGLEFL
jgi:hypothetical protein